MLQNNRRHEGLDADIHHVHQWSFAGLFVKFADSTSLQGIPFILRAGRWYSRLAWTLLFLAAVGLTTWQFIEVIRAGNKCLKIFVIVMPKEGFVGRASPILRFV